MTFDKAAGLYTAPKNYELKKVVLKPKVPNPLLQRDTEYADDYYYYRDPSRFYPYPAPKIKDELILQFNEWEITLKTGPTENFKKVSKIVGEDKAAEVLEVLGL